MCLSFYGGAPAPGAPVVPTPLYWWLYFSYFSDLSNWLELPLYILTIVFISAQFNSECTCVPARQWSVGIASLFLSWASLILFLRKLEVFGKINVMNIN